MVFFYVFYFIFCLCWVFLVLWAFLSSCLSRGCCVGAVLGSLSWRCLLLLQVRCSGASRGGVFSRCRCGARRPLVAVSSPVAGAVLGGLSWRCLLPLQVRCSGASPGGVFSCCRAQAVGVGRHWLRLSDSRAQAQQSWYTCLAVPQPVGTSQTRDQMHIACMTKWILNHWPTREAPMC